ncbi:MAG: hypothetical protein ACJ74W_24240 [Pyrinomonadaceae bacterium]
MSNRKCPNCQLVNWGDAEQCKRCAYPLTAEHATDGAYAPGDLGAQQGASGSAYAQGEAPDAGAPFTGYAAESPPYVAPFNDVGTALSQAWQFYTSNFVLIAKLVLFAAIPFALGQAAMAYRLQTAGSWDFSAILNAVVFSIVRWSLIPATVIYAVLQVRRTGHAPGVGESYRWGASRWLRVTLALLLTWLGCMGILVPAFILMGLGVGARSTGFMGLAMLVLVILFIPLIYVSLGFSLVTPVAALEHKWPLDALTRSWQLTKGVRGRIFGALFVTGFALMVVGIVVGLSVGVAFGLLVSPYIASALSQIITEVAGQLMTVTLLVIYLGLLPAGEQRATVDALGTPAQD